MAAQDDNITLGDIAKKGLGFLNSKLNEVMETNKESQTQALPQSRMQQNSTFCTSCGAQLVGKPKFCPECGNAMHAKDTGEASPTILSQNTNQEVQESTGRTQQYAGVLNKCPNCGEIVDAFDAVCDACGYRIAGRQANSSVQRFHEELTAIEKSRKKKGFWDDDGLTITDKQIITLINTYPVPNNIEEITEFMFMATSNINVELSKQRSTFSKIFGVSQGGTPEKEISDAWVSKMKQIYNKAKLSFSDDPVFGQIQQIYDDKMTQLNM